MIGSEDGVMKANGMTSLGSLPAAFAALLLVGSAPVAPADAAPVVAEIAVSRDTIPAARLLGGRILFSPENLNRLVEEHRQESFEVHVEPPTNDALASVYARRYGINEELALKIVESALVEGIDPELGFRLVRVESVFRVGARGPGGSLGLTQLMPSTARAIDRSLRTDAQILEPTTNLRTGFRYLRRMIDRYDGDVRLGVLAYNRGPIAVDRALQSGRDPENGYSPKVLGAAANRYSGTGITAPTY